MIKFFRKIRQQLIGDNKVSKYLLYAIGEIVLVVIGILIALQINNWNEDRKNSSREHKFLENIHEEVVSDSLGLHYEWFTKLPRKMACLEKTKKYLMGTYIPKDTLQFLADVGYGGVGSLASFEGSSRTYNEMLSTGSLSLITDESLRKQIVEYYDRKAFLKQYTNSVRTRYASYVNSFRVFLAESPDSIETVEIPRMFKKINTDEFHGLINQEITFANSISRVLKFYRTGAYRLSKNIGAHLKSRGDE